MSTSPLFRCLDCGRTGFTGAKAHNCNGTLRTTAHGLHFEPESTAPSLSPMPQNTTANFGSGVTLPRDPADLTLHPLRKQLPTPKPGEPAFDLLIESIRERGLDYPLVIDAEGRVMDGADRWLAAKRLQLTEVPVLVRDSNEAAEIILHGLTQRKHFTKGALAYLAYPLLAAGMEQSRQRKIANLIKNPNVFPKSTQSTSGKSTDQYAAELGISQDLLLQAKSVRDLFAKHGEKRTFEDKASGRMSPEVTFREYFEPRILSGEVGLGAVIAGIASSLANASAPQTKNGQLELFSQSIDTQINRYRYWEELSEPERRTAQSQIHKAAFLMPRDLRDLWLKELKAAARASKQNTVFPQAN